MKSRECAPPSPNLVVPPVAYATAILTAIFFLPVNWSRCTRVGKRIAQEYAYLHICACPPVSLLPSLSLLSSSLHASLQQNISISKEELPDVIPQKYVENSTPITAFS